MTVFVTGDTHGRFKRVKAFCKRMELGADDVVVILGDAGINYFLDARDRRGKHDLGKLEPTFLCIHGNHEERPYNVPGYHETEAFGGIVYVEDEFPNIMFAKDGEVYELGGARCIAIGGAYSVDKWYRLERGWAWFESEQPDDETKSLVEAKLEQLNWEIDVVLSHTVPRTYQPTDAFIDAVDQSTVDASTEKWLQIIEERLTYRRWYAGHYHVERQVGNLRLMFEDWDILQL